MTTFGDIFAKGFILLNQDVLDFSITIRIWKILKII